MSHLAVESSAGLEAAPALRIEGEGRNAFVDCVIEETPVALLYNGHPHAVMMATPRDLHDFALGFALSECIIEQSDEFELVDCLRSADGISLQGLIPSARFEALRERRRNLAGRSGCGLCGVESLQDALRPLRRVESETPIQVEAVRRGMHSLAQRQPLNQLSGGVHAAGFVFGDDVRVREDVGRHNALDKLIGALARSDTRATDAEAWRDGNGFLAITSRASYEIVHKAASAGIAVIAAISAPTSLAIRLADQANVTLIGFARAQAMNIYTHPHRIV